MGTAQVLVHVDPEREVAVQVWYPAVEAARDRAAQGRPVLDFESRGPRRDVLAELLADAPEGCTSRTQHAADAPRGSAEPRLLPLVVFSHCMDCMRYSAFSLVEALAAAGFVVAAPDHEGGTLYDALLGESISLDTATIMRHRLRDLRSTIDFLLSADAALPPGLSGRIDPMRIGVLGHSLGSVTAGLAMEQDPRIRAGAMLMLPFDWTGIPLVETMTAQVSRLQRPALFMLGTEDNGIVELFNDMQRDNYLRHPGERWLVSLRDAGHYSISDIAAIVPQFWFGWGCGDSFRTGTLEPFRYLDNALARDLGGQVLVSFFEKTLRGMGSGPHALSLPPAAQVEYRAP